MTETFTGCDTNFSAVENAVEQLRQWAAAASFGFIAVDCQHIANHAGNIRTLNQQHRLHGYNPAVDDSIGALADRIGHIINDNTFQRAVHPVYVNTLQSNVNIIRRAVALRMQAHRGASNVVPMRRTGT